METFTNESGSNRCALPEELFLRTLSSIPFKYITKLYLTKKNHACFTQYVVDTIYDWYGYAKENPKTFKNLIKIVSTSYVPNKTLEEAVYMTTFNPKSFTVIESMKRIKTAVINGADNIIVSINKGMMYPHVDDIIIYLRQNILKDIKYKETPFELEEFPHIFVDGKKVEYHTFLRRVREGDIK